MSASALMIVRFLTGFGLHAVILSLPLLVVAACTETWPLRPILPIILLSTAAATEATFVDRLRVTERFWVGDGQTRLEIAGCATLLLALWLAVYDSAQSAEEGSHSFAEWLGAVLIGAGATLRVLSIAALGEGFIRSGSGAQPTRLVTSGPYRLLRHPSESGLFLLVTGAGWMLRSGDALAFYVLVGLPITWVRLNAEENALLSRFGASYSDHKASVGALVPHCTLYLRPMKCTALILLARLRKAMCALF